MGILFSSLLKEQEIVITKPCKYITFLRHAESEWNEARWSYTRLLRCQCGDPNIEDPNITKKGKAQVAALRDKMGDSIEWLKQQNIELIVISPYRRALQTFQDLWSVEHVKQAGVNILITPLHGEIAHTSSDIGSSVDTLKAEFIDFDFSNIDNNIWWYNKGQEPNDNWQKRMEEFKQMILNRQETRVLVIGHSKWIMRFTDQPMLYNCQMREYKLPIGYTPPDTSSIRNVVYE